MAQIKTELKWRKKSTFDYKGVSYDRYILVCGMTVFVTSPGNSMCYSRIEVINTREFPVLFGDLEDAYVELVKIEPLSKQDVTFVR